MEQETKMVCPKCAEEVKAEAIVCKHCGSKIKPTSAEKVKKRSKFTIVKWVFVIGLLGMISASINSAMHEARTEGVTQTDNAKVCSMGELKSRRFVKEILKSPSTAEFPSRDYHATELGNNRCEISSYVDSQNSFGATIRSNWSTIVKFNGGSPSDTANWTLEKMVFDGEQVYP